MFAGLNLIGYPEHAGAVQAGGAPLTVQQIGCGDVHTCALLDDGSVKCWGSGLGGALGQGNTANRGDGPGEMGDALPPIALGEGRTAVSISASVRVVYKYA